MIGNQSIYQFNNFNGEFDPLPFSEYYIFPKNDLRKNKDHSSGSLLFTGYPLSRLENKQITMLLQV
jgi:hypothetical protein